MNRQRIFDKVSILQLECNSDFAMCLVRLSTVTELHAWNFTKCPCDFFVH